MTTMITRTHTLSIEVHLQEERCKGLFTEIGSPQTPHHDDLTDAVDFFIRSHHTKLAPHTQIPLAHHGDRIMEVSQHMKTVLFKGEMTRAKAELLMELYVKKIFVGVGGTLEPDEGSFDDVWKLLLNQSGCEPGEKEEYFLDHTDLKVSFYTCVDKHSGDLAETFDDITLGDLQGSDYLYQDVMDRLSNTTHASVKVTALPHDKYDDLWTSLQYSAKFKSEILGHAKLPLTLAESDTMDGMNNKLLILHGPPGSGKTTISKALAHKICIDQKGVLIELSSSRVFSKWFGESAQKLETIFSNLRDVIEEFQSAMFCILIDEVESIASSRAQTMDKNEATDAVRVVNALLTQLDQMRPLKNYIIFGTTNLVSALDDAFLDRADEIFELKSPDTMATYHIIRQSINRLITKKLVTGDEIPLDAKLSEASGLVYAIAEMCHKKLFSGRRLTRLPLMVLAKQGCTGCIPLARFLHGFLSSIISL